MSIAIPESGVDFSRWTFLATPLDELCDLLGIRLETMPGLSAKYQAGVFLIEGRRFLVLPDDENHNRLQCETAARAALADWFDVDTSDWPMEFHLYLTHDGETWHHTARTGGAS